MEDQNGQSRKRRRLFDDIENLVDEAVGTASDSIRDTMRKVRFARDNAVMIRLNKESLAKLDELVDAGITTSRSEAAAFLIAEGIKARQGLFDKISEKTEEIRRTKEELRRLLEEEESQPHQTQEPHEHRQEPPPPYTA